jgi:SAM-dependent methyltransferase
MEYADLTRRDKNPLKRLVQRRRLADAISLIPLEIHPHTIVDFGAGDGELCRQLAERYRDATIVCYEPAPRLREEASRILGSIPNVVIAAGIEELDEKRCDVLFCLEVFEHLPAAQTIEAIEAIERLLAENGVGIIGVPIEVYAPALFKGLFRMSRRRGHFDAQLGNILKATIGAVPRNRPVAEIGPGLPYHKHHLGFDFRMLRKQLEEYFEIVDTRYSPLGVFGSWFNSEVSYVVRRNLAG